MASLLKHIGKPQNPTKNPTTQGNVLPRTRKNEQKELRKHIKTRSSSQETVVNLHLKGNRQSSDDSNVNTLAREDRWIEIRVKEAMCDNIYH